ncbi:hypothetical protein [Amycolatopsis sp. GM8]|uniref:NAD(P)H-dependent amine dehydrogenase family protein n=1 Tax=Amycolatopsis sp. GM8 TaxID=2896530 RepID=UPI001F26A631|nr:hypothetical protein [Amycolatopsis sp. GM8]
MTRVGVFGPGGMGSVAIYEITQRPELELAAVRCYSRKKAGRDVGELLGLDRIGVTITDDPDEALAARCDCVLYCARDTGDNSTDDEILHLLASGANVITPIPYHNAALWREPEFTVRLGQACTEGGSTFHSTGMSPDLVSERLALALTGMTADLRSLTIRENWPAHGLGPVLLEAVGLGLPVAEAQRKRLPATMSKNVLRSVGRSIEHALGVTFDRVEETHEFLPAPVDTRAGRVSIAAGTVGRIRHRFRGWESAELPLFTLELNWFIGPENLPDGVNPGEYWIVEIEGRPSARMTIDLRASLENDDRFFRVGARRTDPGYHGTIAACLQALPHVIAAPPGILPSFEAPLHWTRDLGHPWPV